MVRIFNKGENIKLTDNFSSREFECKCHYSDCKHTLIDLAHVDKLQELRNLSGVLWISSGYRCHKHNMAVGGVINSQHTKGTATDLIPKDTTLAVLFENIEAIGFRGVGVYNTFIHTDGREGDIARWDKT